jgi:hypothetical protein
MAQQGGRGARTAMKKLERSVVARIAIEQAERDGGRG